MSFTEEDSFVIVNETNSDGDIISTRRKVDDLLITDSSRAFSEVSNALGLDLSELYVSSPHQKKMLAENFNLWLSNPNLKGFLRLQDKNLNEIPVFITGLVYDCDQLDLQYNNLTQIPDMIGCLEKLRTLDISNNCLCDSKCIPNRLKSLEYLQRLSLGGNQLSCIPECIFSLHQITWLDLQDNCIDNIPDEFCDLENLHILDIQDNDIPYLPSRIGNLKQLTTLYIGGNILIEPLPSSFYKLHHLRTLSLRSTAMESIPLELLEMIQLISLDISHNSLQVLPSEIGNLVNLTYLDISHNLINSFPITFGWLINLNELKWKGKYNTLENVPPKALRNHLSLRLHYRNLLRKDPETRAKLFFEKECDNNIRIKSEDDELIIQGGTVEKLVRYLTYHETTSLNFTRCFLLLYQSFTTSKELLALLILRYNTCELENSKIKIIKARVLNTLSKWMDVQSRQFDEELLKVVEQFADTLPEKDKIKLEKSIKRVREGKTTVVNRRQTSTPKPILPSISTFPISTLDPKEFARQLCLLEYEYFSKILPEEFLNQNWTRVDKAVKAPNLTSHIQYFNRFSAVVATTILKHKDTKQRVQVLSFFINVAEECRILYNFNTVIEIVAALQGSAIHRLKGTWKLVSNRLKNIWQNLQNLMSMENNAKLYRQALKEVSSARIPNIGTILKDLTFLNDGNPDIIGNNPELINFSKLRLLEGITEKIQHYQRHPYNFEKVIPIRNFIFTTETWDEVKAYNESLICEDREGRTPAMRGEIIIEHTDTYINLDVTLTSEQLKLAEKSHGEWKDTQLQLGLTTGAEVSKSGTLLLREDGVWKKLWFSLEYPSLYYYKDQTEKRPTGVIKLLGVTVEKIGKKKNFAIVIAHPSGRAYAIRGDNDKVSLSWYDELCSLVNSQK